jgi:glycosyltransferase involved in cell wall biosynthesis
MPIYNTQDYLENAVNSVLAQSYPDWELILVDDGSTDNSLEIMKNCAKTEPRIKVFHNSKNEGIARARIFATQHCSGDFICEIDSDDSVSPDFLEKMFITQQKTQCDIVNSELVFVYPQKNVAFYKNDKFLDKIFTGQDVFDLALQHKVHGIFLCRSEVYKSAYNLENLSFSAFNIDEFCAMLVFYFGKSLAFSEGKYFYMIRQNSIMQTHAAYHFGNINTSFAFLDFCKDKKLPEFSLDIAKMNAIATFVHFVIYYVKYHRNFSSQEKIEIKQLLKNTKKRLKTEIPNKIYGFKNHLKYIAFKLFCFVNFNF